MRKLCILLTIILSCFFTACQREEKKSRSPYYIPPFSTQYTEEEHIKKIEEKTHQIFKQQVLEGEIVNVFVDIVYSLKYDLPEFFVVELEYAKEIHYPRNACSSAFEMPVEKQDFWTKYKHLMGYIQEEKYYSEYVKEDTDFHTIQREFLPGRSPYSYKGYFDCKKYYGCGLYAVEHNGEMVLLADRSICDTTDWFSGIEFHLDWDSEKEEWVECTKGGIVPQEAYERYRWARYPYILAYKTVSELQADGRW